MAKGVDAIDALPQTFRCALRDALRHEVDTADRIENPDLVARAGPAVVAAVAVEGGKLRRARRESQLLLIVGTIFVAKQPLELRADIVAVHPASGSDVLCLHADWEAVLHHLLAPIHVAHCVLVAGRNVPVARHTVPHPSRQPPAPCRAT